MLAILVLPGALLYGCGSGDSIRQAASPKSASPQAAASKNAKPAATAKATPRKNLGVADVASLTPRTSWATEVDESVLAGKRGAFNGISFSVLFNGTFDRNGAATGNLAVNNSGGSGTTTAPSPNVNVGNNGDVQIQTVIRNFQGATGIFQIAQVPGSFNVVNNNLFVQVNILNDASGIPSLPSLLNTAVPRF
ncbi:MAG: hypothetical protein FJX67_05255 [Alphaproteobacteria bacterium]|nr:hypothetical protein [Alphaproteobacteria bacterium]